MGIQNVTVTVNYNIYTGRIVDFIFLVLFSTTLQGVIYTTRVEKMQTNSWGMMISLNKLN